MVFSEDGPGGIRNLVQRVAPLTIATPCSDLRNVFKAQNAESLVVVDGTCPVGIVTSRALAEGMSSRFGYDLYSNRPVSELMSREFQVLEAHESLARAVDMVFGRSKEQMYLEIVVVEGGNYLGLLSVARLLSEQHLTITRQMEALTAVNDRLGNTIAELTSTQLSLVRARDEAEVANRAKDSFLSIVSHELRTPMNGILGMTQLVLDTALTDEQLECVQIIQSSADLMMSLIDQILDRSKITSGRLQIESNPYDLREAVLEVVKPLSATAWNKNLDFDLSVSPEIPSMIVGDSVRVKQIIANLAGNAVKFTESGQVAVRIEPLLDAPETMHIIVSDSGIGIPEAKQACIFEPFVQSDVSTTRRYGGTGLGLSIVKDLARLMKGDVWLKSIPGVGSEFHVSLECVPIDTEPPHVTCPKEVYAGSVVMVRRLNKHREYLDGVIRSWGYQLAEVQSLHTALDAANLSGEQPVIVFDIPRVSHGISWNEEVKVWYADPSHRGTRVVFLAYLQEDLSDLEHLPGLLFTIVQKPVQLEELHRAISRGVSVSQDQQRPPQCEHDGTGDLRILVAEDNEINALVVSKYLRKIGHRISIAQNGEEAVETARREYFDAILMDIHMPVMDGLEATKRIRRLPGAHFASIDIIALTADAMPDDRKLCLDAGMTDYLTKPVDFSELRAKLERISSGRLIEVQ